MRISDWSSDVCSSDLRFAFTYTNIDRDSYDPDATPVRTFDSRGTNGRSEYQGILNITQGIEATFGAEREKSRLRTAAPSTFDHAPLPAHARATPGSLYGRISPPPPTGFTATTGIRTATQHKTR